MGAHAQTDQELMAAIRAGDATAFDAFFDRHRGAVREYARSVVCEAAAADDLVQEVFLRVWTRAEQFADRGEPRAWLLRITLNLALNRLRTVRRRREVALQLPGEDRDDESHEPRTPPAPPPPAQLPPAQLTPAQIVELAEQQALLEDLVDQLPGPQRLAFELVREAELGIGEAAATLGIPEGTVRSRLHYAARQLARQWRELAAEWEDL